MTTVVSILMSDLVPLRERGVWQGIINIIYATGSGTGAPLGTETQALPSRFANFGQVEFWPIISAGDGTVFPNSWVSF